MAIARVQGFSTGVTKANALTKTISLTGVTVGHGLIVCIADAVTGGTTVSGVSDTFNTYSAVTGAAALRTNTSSAMWICKSVATGGSLTLTVTFALAAEASLIVIEVSGQDTVTFVDKLILAQGTSTAANSGPTAATSQANEFVVGMISKHDTAAATLPTFSTALTSQTVETFADDSTVPTISLDVVDGLLAASGVAETFSATTNSIAWIALCVTFLPSAAVAGANPPPIRQVLQAVNRAGTF